MRIAALLVLLLPLAGCASDPMKPSFMERLLYGDRTEFEPLALYNRYVDIHDLTIEGGGYRMHRDYLGSGGQLKIPEAFPPTTKQLRVSWTNGKTGDRIVLERVPIEPWEGPVDEFGLEIELVIGAHWLWGGVEARRRPFGGELKRDEHYLRPSVRPTTRPQAQAGTE